MACIFVQTPSIVLKLFSFQIGAVTYTQSAYVMLATKKTRVSFEIRAYAKDRNAMNISGSKINNELYEIHGISTISKRSVLAKSNKLNDGKIDLKDGPGPG